MGTLRSVKNSSIRKHMWVMSISDDLSKILYSESLRINLNNSELRIEKADIKTEGLKLNLNGAVSEIFTEPVLNIDLSAEVETSKLFKDNPAFSKDSGKGNLFTSIPITPSILLKLYISSSFTNVKATP